MATWQFASGDNEVKTIWTEMVVRDAEKQQFWGPFMHAPDSPESLRHPESNKGLNIIKVHTDLQGEDKRGEKIRIHNVARITGRGVHGDALLRDTGADLSTYTMDVGYDSYAMQARSAGKLSEKRVVLNFRENAKTELASWLRRKKEQGITRHLWGLATPYNSSKFNCWDATEASIFGNAISAYSGNYLKYAGDATSAATLDSSDVMTAQLLTKLETAAMEDLDTPLETINIGGKDGLLLFLPSRGVEQLQYDSDWRDAQASNTRSPENPKITGYIGTYGNIHVIKYALCPQVQAATDASGVVNRGILAGANALQMLRVEDPSWYEDYEDTRKRRAVISIGGMDGLARTSFNSTTRNAMAVDFYARA
jgi:N4-gp56 family major capsid protein